MRLAVYTDYVYRRTNGTVRAERAFALFLAALAPHLGRFVLIGRVAPDGGAQARVRASARGRAGPAPPLSEPG